MASAALFSQAFAPLPQPSVTTLKAGHRSLAQIKQTAKEFETNMVSSMLKPMFEGLSTAAPFGGGEGEEMFRSFLIDAMAKQVTKAGGLKLSGAVEAELVRMQGGAQ
jgi:Rod binding domain-containing protein